MKGGVTNVVFIIFDTTRADRLGVYGSLHPTSPTIDALAKGGVRFANAHANTSWTRPGFANLLTGRYARSVGIYEERFDTLPEDVITLPERLAERGYHTLGLTANPNIGQVFGFAQGFADYRDSAGIWGWMREDGRPIIDTNGVVSEDATWVTDRALALVDANANALKSAPLYLQVLYVDPHRPWRPPDVHRAPVEASGSKEPRYDGEIRYADAELSRLLAGLKDRGLMDDTLLVFTSDHGEGLQDHPGISNTQYHGNTLYDSVTHVPLVLHHPTLPAGRVVEPLVAGIDLTPTVMELLGWPLSDSAELDGRSLVPLLTGDDPERTPWVIAETDFRFNRKEAVIGADARYIWNVDAIQLRQGIYEGPRLLDRARRMLEASPDTELYVGGAAEKAGHNNRVAAEPGRVAEMETLLAAWRSQTPSRPPLNRTRKDGLVLADGTHVPTPGVDPQSDEVVLDPAIEQRLRDLGYLP